MHARAFAVPFIQARIASSVLPMIVPFTRLRHCRKPLDFEIMIIDCIGQMFRGVFRLTSAYRPIVATSTDLPSRPNK
jgi:hypothetical protein